MSPFAGVRLGIALRYAPVAALCTLLAAGCASSAASVAGPGTPSSTSSAAAVVVVRDDANGKTVNVQVGTTVELILSSTYWSVAGPSAPTVLRQAGNTTVLPRPTNCPNIPGLGCAPVRTDFTAVAPGTSSIKAERTTCGEAMPCAPNQKHFAVTVVVQ